MVLVLQKRVLRLMYFANSRAHAVPLFVDVNILPLNFLYYEASNLMHGININIATVNILNLLVGTPAILDPRHLVTFT